MWDQWRALLVGLATVPGPIWISHPSAITTAENKAAQLAVAASVGLRVPHTLWTNDLEEARTFMLASGRAVVKTVATAFWEVEGHPHFVFARAVAPDDLPDAQAFAAAPICVQHLISPKRDLRVTVVGHRFFAAERGTSHGEPLDWRLAERVPWHQCEIPDIVGKGCIAITRELGLRFAGVDLVLNAEGEHTFIELNPNGEWGWLESSGLQIASAIADELCGE